MGSVDEVVVVMFNAIFSEAILQSLSECVDLALGFLKRVAIVATMLLTFLCLDKAVAGSQNASALRASLYPLTPEGECLVCGQLRGSLREHLCP